MVLSPVSFRPEYKTQISGNNAAVPALPESKPVFSGLKNEIDRLDKSASQNWLYALSPVPTARRMGSLPDTLANEDYTRAGLLAGIAAASFPGDFREMGLAFKEGQNIFKNGLSAIKFEGQHQAKFFQNTFLASLADKFPWLNKVDKTLYNTGFGEFIRRNFNINIAKGAESIGEASKLISGDDLNKFKFTGNYVQRLTGRTLMRLPVIGLFATAIMEVPALIDSVKKEGTFIDKVKSFTNQLCKSAGYVGLVNAGIAIGGAVLLPYGYIAALIGMGIGSCIGLITSKGLNKQIDKVIS